MGHYSPRRPRLRPGTTPCLIDHHIPRVAEGDQGGCVNGRGGLEVGGLAGTSAAGLDSGPVEGGPVAAGWLEHATEMPRRIAATERFLIGELLVWSGRAHAYWLAAGP